MINIYGENTLRLMLEAKPTTCKDHYAYLVPVELNKEGAS